jgi:hypothetical protein
MGSFVGTSWANAVKVTLGPRGRNVVLDSAFGSPTMERLGALMVVSDSSAAWAGARRRMRDPSHRLELSRGKHGGAVRSHYSGRASGRVLVRRNVL